MFIGCKNMVRFSSSYSLLYDKVLPGLSAVVITANETALSLDSNKTVNNVLDK